MNDKMIQLYSLLAARLHTARTERGQGTLEYVGIAIVAAILVAAVVTAVTDSDIETTIKDNIQDIIDRSPV